MTVLDPKTGSTVTLCDHGQLIDARERFAMKALADAERRRVDLLIDNHRALVARTYPQTDSGDETSYEGC